jgi:adenylate cyclase
LENTGEWIRFEVSDTGIGIGASQKENLFKEFAQADTSISRKYGGTGLGLAISYKFVQLMKGRIAVVSELGRGAKFTVELPAQVKIAPADTHIAETAAKAHSPIPIPVSDRETILVIDDDAAVRDLMSRSLSKLDFNIVAVSSGDEGLRVAKQLRPVIITLDVVMPNRDGWSVLNQLKADPELAKIPVIMVTIVDNEAMGVALGASSYLVKPVDRERLVTLIQKHRLSDSTAAKTLSDAAVLTARSQTAGGAR